MDKKVLYQELINEAIVEIGQNPQYLENLMNDITADTGLSDDDKKALSISVVNTNAKLSGINSDGGGSNRSDDLFPRYSFDGDDQECGLKANDRDKYGNYADWLLHFLNVYHPMPRKDLQHPVIACLMLMNSICAKPSSHFPLIYIQGMPGCGKSKLGDSFLLHYPKHLFHRVSPADTGASLRDGLDRMGQGKQPAICLFDNWWFEASLKKLDVYRSIILANSYNDAVCHLSTKGDNAQSTFRTHCIKVFTSVDSGIDPASMDIAEIARRLWIVICLNTKEKPPSKDLYNWDGMQKEYQKIWGHENELAVKTQYGKLLSSVYRIKEDKIHVDAKIWELMLVPLAVWQFVGLGSLEDGIKAFTQHYEWTHKQDNAAVDSMLLAINDYLVQHEKSARQAVAKFGDNPLMTPDEKFTELMSCINPEDLKDHIRETDGFVIGQQAWKSVQQIMTNKGYLYKVIKSKGVFVKQS